MVFLAFESRRILQLTIGFGLTLFFYSCKNDQLTIVVPDGYHGEVCLVKSTSDQDRLEVDKNGIGYVSFKTFNRLESKPKVLTVSGKDLSENCVGYSPSAFWAVGETSASYSNLKIRYKSFEIVPDSLIGQKQYYDIDLYKFVDTTLIKGR